MEMSDISIICMLMGEWEFQGFYLFIFEFVSYHLSIRHGTETGDKDVGLDLSHLFCRGHTEKMSLIITGSISHLQQISQQFMGSAGPLMGNENSSFNSRILD